MIQVFADNYDLTPIIQQTVDVVESMRKEYGNRSGMTTAGEEIIDLIITKFDPQFRTIPLTGEYTTIVQDIMKRKSITLRYTSRQAGGGLRSIKAAPLGFNAHYVMDTYLGVPIYDGEIIAFRQLSV